MRSRLDDGVSVIPTATYGWSSTVANNGAVAGLCRLVLRTPSSTFELTVPTDVRIADLLPTVVGHAGTDLYESGLEHEGWILQRLGGPALDAESTVEALELHDGDALYLRPRRAEMPAVHFDDLVDGMITALGQRGDSWRPALSRRLLLVCVLALLGTGFAVLTVSGPHAPRAAAAAVVALLLLAGAASAARAVGDAAAGTAFGVSALPFTALSAGLLPTGVHPDLLGAQLLAGGAAATGMTAVALAVVGAAAPLFLAVGLGALLVTVGGLAMVLGGLAVGQAAALVAVVVVVLGVFIPPVGLRLSGLRLPALPGNSEQLQDDIEPHEAASVLARSEITNQYVTSLYVALGALYIGCLSGIVTEPGGWATRALLAVLGLLAVLHGRSFGSVPQRLAMVVPGIYGLALFAVALGVWTSGAMRLAVVAVLLLLAACTAIASWTVPGRRMLPHWGHIVNLAHTLLAISVVPLMLLMFGVFSFLRRI
jgi:type VII secretion integral membrane protein EccD